MPRPLRVLFFDIDDTVYSTSEFSHAARQNAVRAMIKAGLQISEDDLQRELDEVIQEFGSNYEHHLDKLVQRLPASACANVLPIIAVAAGMVAYHQTKFRQFAPYEDAIAVLGQLRERGLRLGIITAGVAIKQAEKIVRLGLHQIVEAANIYITDLIGIAKTNPKIYLRACKEAGAEPGACLYVGDNPTVDVEVPSRIGMRTALSRRSGKYASVELRVPPDHIIHNFWDMLEIIEKEYEIIRHER